MARDAVADYVDAGERFVVLIEAIEQADRDHLVGDLAIALADLYSAAARLPTPVVKGSWLTPGMGMDAKQSGFWRALRTTQAVLEEDAAEWALDWEEHRLLREDVDESWKVVVDLANNLAEAYSDVRDQLAKLGNSNHRDEAIHDVRDEFWMHTGDHVSAALRILQARLSDDGGPRPPLDDEAQ